MIDPELTKPLDRVAGVAFLKVSLWHLIPNVTNCKAQHYIWLIYWYAFGVGRWGDDASDCV